MSEQFAPDAIAGILQRDILPVVLSGEPSPNPTVVLLSGQPGSGRSRAAGAIARAHVGDMAVISSDELRAFHPSFGQRDAHSLTGDADVERTTAGWLRECIAFARTLGHSVLLEGAFQDPAVVRGTVGQFAAAGFTTHVAVVGARRADSLLSTLSHYLRGVQENLPSRYTSRAAHDRAFEGIRALVAGLEAEPGGDRLTIIGRRGEPSFTAERGDVAGFGCAADALDTARGIRMSRLEATQWLSELHHVTTFANSRRDLPRDARETLVELHEIALSKVIPELHAPANARFAEMLTRTTSAQLAALRGSLEVAARPDLAAPTPFPSVPVSGGISR